MHIEIRQTQRAEYIPTEILTQKAFADRSRLPGECDEHFLLYNIRKHEDYIPELDFVAYTGGELVGHIAFTRCRIEHADAAHTDILSFGPLSVLPSWQSKGIGSALITHTIKLAKEMPYPAILILGHTEYYPRFGFRPAAEYSITMVDGSNFDAFMALELHPGSLWGLQGRYIESPCLHIDQQQAQSYKENIFAKYRS